MTKRPTTPVSGESNDVTRTVGHRVREARQKAGLTQAQLGALTEAPQSYIFEIESGGANITIKTLAKVAASLGLDARDLLPESQSAPLSAASSERLRLLLQQVVSVALERHAQEAALIAELRAYLGAPPPLEQPTHTDHALRTSAPSFGGGDRDDEAQKPPRGH